MKHLPDGTPVRMGVWPEAYANAPKTPFKKSDLPKGPWTDEPDYAEWDHEGIKCIVLRGPLLNFNGYLGIPVWNVFFHCSGEELSEHGLELHGGITYGPERRMPGRPGITSYWWVGFDTVHAWDYSPGLEYTTCKCLGVKYNENEFKYSKGESVYRDFAYCVNCLQTAAEAMAEGAVRA